MLYAFVVFRSILILPWCLSKHENAFRLADLLATVVPLGHAFGRIGCFFYGCCYGRDSSAWCAVTFPAGSPSWYARAMIRGGTGSF